MAAKSRIPKSKRQALLSARKRTGNAVPVEKTTEENLPVMPARQVAAPEELATMWDDEIADAYAGLSEKQAKFLHAYLHSGNAADAYRKAYNPLASPHLASVCGNVALTSAGMVTIMERLTRQRVANLLLVEKTFREMSEAVKPNWVQDEEGQWENAGDEPDWKARKDGADGLARLDALYAPVESNLNIQAKVALVELPVKKALP